MEAANLQRGKKKTIADAKSSGTSKDFQSRTQEHFRLMYDVQREKMNQQTEIQLATMEFQDKQLEIEREKLNRENKIVLLKEEKLMGEVMKDIANHNFDMMKKRKEMKELYPDITDAQLDNILPLRFVPT